MTVNGLKTFYVTNYYNPLTNVVDGKYKYFYAEEVSTDQNHVISTKFKTLTLTAGNIPESNPVVTTFINNSKVSVTLIKTSSNPTCTNGNDNYSLKGAEYSVYRKSDNQYVGKLTTKADGTTNSLDVSNWMNIANDKFTNTEFYVKETKAAEKGYLIDTQNHSVIVRPSDNPATVNVQDVPVNDPLQLEITKTDTVTGSNVVPEGKSLEGAKFKVTFYAVDTSTMHTAADLKANYSNKINAQYNKEVTVTKRNDGRYIANLGGVTFPLGFITLEEVNPPQDYTLDNATATIKNGTETIDITNNLVFVTTYDFTQNKGYTYYPNDAATFAELSTKGVRMDSAVVFNIEVQNTPVRGNLDLLKLREEDDAPLEGVKFEIKNDTTGEVHYIYTDATGKASTEVTAYTANVNYYDNVTDYDGTANEVWFGKNDDGTYSDPANDKAGNPLGALPVGQYTVTELKCAANDGYQLLKPFQITVNDTSTVLVQERDGKLFNVEMPSIRTRALVETADGTESKVLPAAPGQTIHDICTYKNLKVNTTYTLMGTLMIIDEDGNATPFIDDTGKAAKGRTVFTTKTNFLKSEYEAKGEETVEFTDLDFSNHQGETFVVFEQLYLGDVTEADVEAGTFDKTYPEGSQFEFPILHEEATDLNQTVKTPDLHTEAADISTSKTLTKADTITIVDHVTYTGLEIGKEYTVTGTLNITEDGKTSTPLKGKDGNPVTAEKTFTAETVDGTVDVEFTFEADLITSESETIVIFEDGYDKEKKVKYASHADVTDTNQYVRKPSISTTAKGTEERSELVASSDRFIDTVTIKNLEPNKVYTLRGIAMDKATGEALKLNGKTVEAEVQFTSGAANNDTKGWDGEVNVEFTITEDMQADLEGKDLVVFEALSNEVAEVIATHNDINDKGQELVVPTIRTTLTDQKTGTHMAYPEEKTTLVDTVTYKNLIAGKKYVMSGTLMRQDNGEPLLDEKGNQITASKEFTADDSGSGTVDIVFTFNAALLKLQGETVVAFEECIPTDGRIPVGVHADIKDEGQTVRFPKAKTKVSKSEWKNTDTISLTDTISYTNFVPGETYVARGWLVDMSGKQVANVQAEKEFKPTAKDGTVDVKFADFSASGLSGKYVVFEEIYYKKTGKDGKVSLILIAEHKDTGDSDQTITVTTVPKTGDELPIIPLAVAMTLAFIGSIAVVVIKKRRTDK